MENQNGMKTGHYRDSHPLRCYDSRALREADESEDVAHRTASHP
jgi:hypothetical protein